MAPYTVTQANDCDDTNPWVHPNISEICNGIDDNCDNNTDEEGAHQCSYYFRDSDQDSYGLAEDKRCLCAPDHPYTSTKTQDCDDSNPVNYPFNQEICDGSDNNCNYVVDEANTPDCTVFYRDQDSDGYGSSESKCLCGPDGFFKATESNDCSDGNPSINPGKSETCSTYKIDDNCDGDHYHPDDGTGSLYYKDQDGDGFGDGDPERLCEPLGMYKVTKGEDCNDNAIQIHPNATEICNDVDDNCNNSTDESLSRLCATSCGAGLETCDSGSWVGCTAQAPKTCTNYISCNSELMCVNSCPAKPSETCNGVDDDCNGKTDEYLTRSCSTLCSSGLETCSYGNWGGCTATQPNFCKNYDTCAWGDMCVSFCPGEPPETCNGKDDNCNGSVDEYLVQNCNLGCGSGIKTCSWGSWSSCSTQAPKSCKNYDTCTDEDMCTTSCPTKPTEVCNQSDDDCDGNTDEGFKGDISYSNIDLKDTWDGPQLSIYPANTSGTVIGKLIPSGDEDWFSIRAVENKTDFFGDTEIKGKVTLSAPSGVYYRVCVCWTENDNKCDLSEEKCVSTYSSSPSTTVNMSMDWLFEDKGYLDVRVYAPSGHESCNTWSVTWEIWE